MINVLAADSKSIEKEIAAAKEMLKDVSGGFEQAVRRSLNRAATSARAGITKAVREEYTPKPKYIRRDMKVKKANKRVLEASVHVFVAPLPLRAFSFRPKTNTTGNVRKPVRVAVQKEGGLKRLGASFVWNGLILKRRGTASLPVDTVYGPSVPTMAGRKTVSERIEQTMRSSFIKNLDHEAKYLLRSKK